MPFEPFEQVPVGKTALAISRLGFGSASIAGLFSAVSDDDATAMIEHAWDAGVRYFDTAPQYGYGLAERRLGGVPRASTRATATCCRPRWADCCDRARPRQLAEPSNFHGVLGRPAGVRLQRGRHPAVAGRKPGATRPRPDRHRVPPRPRRPLAGRHRRGVPGAARAARPGRRRSHRRGHEPGRRCSAGSHARRTWTSSCAPVATPCSTSRRSRSCCRRVRHGASRWSSAGSLNSGILSDPDPGRALRLRGRRHPSWLLRAQGIRRGVRAPRRAAAGRRDAVPAGPSHGSRRILAGVRKPAHLDDYPVGMRLAIPTRSGRTSAPSSSSSPGRQCHHRWAKAAPDQAADAPLITRQERTARVVLQQHRQC